MGTGPDMYNLLFPPRLVIETYLNLKKKHRYSIKLISYRLRIESDIKLLSYKII